MKGRRGKPIQRRRKKHRMDKLKGRVGNKNKNKKQTEQTDKQNPKKKEPISLYIRLHSQTSILR